MCLDSKSYPLITLQCKHSFHEGCLMSWIEKNLNCPICRSENMTTYTLQKKKSSKPRQKKFKIKKSSTPTLTAIEEVTVEAMQEQHPEMSREQIIEHLIYISQMIDELSDD